MIFKDIIRDVELYLHIQGAESRYLIKKFINDSIINFMRMREWDHTKFIDDITLDGSESYNLDTILTHRFEGEKDLMTDGGVIYDKYDYETYLQLSSKSYAYAILGNTIYVEGDTGTLKFVYYTPGTPYPLKNPTDVNFVTQYYADIISKMSAIDLLDYLDDATVAKERQKLQLLLTILRSKENRIRHNGKKSMVHR